MHPQQVLQSVASHGARQWAKATFPSGDTALVLAGTTETPPPVFLSSNFASSKFLLTVTLALQLLLTVTFARSLLGPDVPVPLEKRERGVGAIGRGGAGAARGALRVWRRVLHCR